MCVCVGGGGGGGGGGGAGDGGGGVVNQFYSRETPLFSDSAPNSYNVSNTNGKETESKLLSH